MPQVQKRLSASSIKNGGLPNITGTWDLRVESNYAAAGQNYSGALQPRGNSSNISRPASSGRSTWDYGIDFNASRSSSIYGASSYVIPRNIKVLYCVKF